jgi:hypothetical protein
MKKTFAIFAMCLLCGIANAQANLFSAGECVTAGPPNFNPGSRGCRTVLDTSTMHYWIWKSGTTWTRQEKAPDPIIGCSVPLYTPTKHQSDLAINQCTPNPILYKWNGSVWQVVSGGGGGGSVNTDATLSGDGTLGTPLKIAQQSASTSQVLSWTGATWIPSWGNPYIFVTSGATITTAVNEILIGTVSANITMGLPTCDATTDQKHFKFVRNGTDNFSVTIDPAGSQTFYDLTLTKIQYGKLAIDCTCRFSGGTGVWFFDNQ